MQKRDMSKSHVVKQGKKKAKALVPQHKAKPPMCGNIFLMKHFRYDGNTGRIYYRKLKELPPTTQRRGGAIKARRDHIESWNKNKAGREVQLSYSYAVEALTFHVRWMDPNSKEKHDLRINASHFAWAQRMKYWPSSVSFFNDDWTDLRWINLYIPRNKLWTALADRKHYWYDVPEMPRHMFSPHNPCGHFEQLPPDPKILDKNGLPPSWFKGKKFKRHGVVIDGEMKEGAFQEHSMNSLFLERPDMPFNKDKIWLEIRERRKK